MLKRKERKRNKIIYDITGPGWLYLDSDKWLKTDKARKQIKLLKQIKEKMDSKLGR